MDIKLRQNLEKARLHPMSDPRRGSLENDLAAELIPVAKRMAANAAWRIRRPDWAEEVWGEAIAQTIHRHDPRKGLMLSYLNSSIRGLMNALVQGDQHTGTATILHDYGATVREAEDTLRDLLGRAPSDGEVADRTDLSPRLVGEVRRARAACVHVGGDELEFLLQHAVEVASSTEPTSGGDLMRRLRDLPPDWREIIYLHFHDRLSVAEVMAVTSLPEDAVITTIDAALTMLRGESEPPSSPTSGDQATT